MNATALPCSETHPESCSEGSVDAQTLAPAPHGGMDHPFDSLPLDADDAPGAPIELTQEEEDNYPMPSPDQVARNMARALKFRDAPKYLDERLAQIVEGRKMTKAESQGPRKERAPQKSPQAKSQNPIPAPAPVRADGAPAKKRRSRNRAKGKTASRPAGASSQPAAMAAC